MSDRTATSDAPHDADSRAVDYSIVVARLAAVGLLAWLVPVAGMIALAGLIFIWIVRARVDLTALMICYGLALWLIPSRYTAGPYAITGAMVFALIALLLWCYGKLLPSSRLARGPSAANRVVGAYFLVILLGYLLAVARPISDIDGRSADRNLVVVILLCAVSVAMTDGLRTRRQIDLVLGSVVVGATLVAGIGFLQYYAHFDIASYLHPPGFNATGLEKFIYSRSGFPRVAGTARHPIEFGIALAAALPMSLHYAKYARTALGRSASVFATAIIAAAIPLSLSRSAALSAILVLALLLPTWSPGRRWRTIVALLVVLLTFNALAPGIFPTIGKLLEGKAGQGSLQTRGDATTIGLNLLWNRPVFGYGFSTTVPSPVIIDNLYITTAAETGIVGLLGLGTLIFGGIAVARRARKRLIDPAGRDLAQAMVAVIAAVALGGWGLDVMRYPITAGMMFIAIGTAGALLRMSERPGAPAPPPVRELEGATA